MTDRVSEPLLPEDDEDDKVIAKYAAKLTGDDADVRREAAELLARFGRDILIAAARDPRAHVRISMDGDRSEIRRGAPLAFDDFDDLPERALGRLRAMQDDPGRAVARAASVIGEIRARGSIPG